MPELSTLQDSLIFAYQVITTQMAEGVRIGSMEGGFLVVVLILFFIYLCFIVIFLPSLSQIREVVREELQKERKKR